MMMVLWGLLILVGVALIVWGSELFAEHLAAAAVRLGISSFALALLLAGAEPEELATAVTASVRNLPAIAFGDVVGTNIAMCLVALGVGALIAPLPLRHRVLRYALLALPLGGLSTYFTWDGTISRLEGIILMGLYGLYVAGIWLVERRPPELGEAGELDEIAERVQAGQAGGARKDVLLVLAGLAGLVVGSMILVEAVRQISAIEATQTTLSLTVVGFATAFELIVLAWSTARRGVPEAAVAAVMGSFVYNTTMTLGAAAVVRPLTVLDATLLHFPLIVMLGSLAFVLVLAVPNRQLGKARGGVLLVSYLVFVGILLVR
jgi:cation:H+ antiporter